jgi:hypothetical protein
MTQIKQTPQDRLEERLDFLRPGYVVNLRIDFGEEGDYKQGLVFPTVFYQRAEGKALFLETGLNLELTNIFEYEIDETDLNCPRRRTLITQEDKVRTKEYGSGHKGYNKRKSVLQEANQWERE